MPVEPATTEWWFICIWAVAGVVVGAAVLTQPVDSAIALLKMVAVYWLVGGLLQVLGPMRHPTPSGVWQIAGGAFTAFVALIILGRPPIPTLSFTSLPYLLIAASALVNALTWLFSGRNRSTSRVVLCVLQLVLGLLMLGGYFDVVELKVLVQAIGLVAIGGGISAGALAFRFKHRAPAHT